ncbi:MAG TPA: Hpt domain-containing protein [Candidatus Limnocylindrales bacterium]|nr:Hpt domain-containing protein [Candidatus Limnocylindrales bacterium]
MASPIDAATFANLLENTGGDREFVDELVDIYVREGDTLVESLVVAAAANRIGDLVLPAHSLKSSSLNLGALELGELCRRLETEARGGTVANPVDRANEVKAAFADARAALLDERQRRPG